MILSILYFLIYNSFLNWSLLSNIFVHKAWGIFDGKALFLVGHACEPSLPGNSNCRTPGHQSGPELHRHRTGKQRSLVCIAPWPVPTQSLCAHSRCLTSVLGAVGIFRLCSELLGYAWPSVPRGFPLPEVFNSWTGQLPTPSCNTLSSCLSFAFLRKQG